jgi:hypothetical protein
VRRTADSPGHTLSPQASACGLKLEVQTMSAFPSKWPSIVAVCVLALTGCQTTLQDQPATLEHYQGRLTSGCAPNDAPSTVLELKSAMGPSQVFFNLWPASPLSIPGEVRFEGSHSQGWATYCTEPDACQPAEWGEIAFADPNPDGLVRGDWTLGLAAGRMLRGTFEADWLAIQALCG